MGLALTPWSPSLWVGLVGGCGKHSLCPPFLRLSEGKTPWKLVGSACGFHISQQGYLLGLRKGFSPTLKEECWRTNLVPWGWPHLIMTWSHGLRPLWSSLLSLLSCFPLH